MHDPAARAIEDFRTDMAPDEIRAADLANTRAIASQAYLAAFPAWLHFRQLTELIAGLRHLRPDVFPLGAWFLMRRLSTPATTTVSPNVDTLYGASYVLLDRQGPVVLSVPPIPDRYFSVALTDASFNVFGIVGPRTYDAAGGDFLLVERGWTGDVPAGIRAVIEAPTPSVCLLQRVYVRDAGEIEGLHAVQDAIRLRPLAGWGTDEASFPAVDIADLELQGVRATSDPIEFFRHMNAYLGWNPPGERELSALFATAGVGPGSAVPDDDDLQTAIRHGAADARALIDARLSAGSVRDGWRVPDPASGLPGPHILRRAVTQATQMGIFPLEEAIYFFAYHDGAGRPLDGRRPAVLRFAPGGLPPLHELGFWSLTMYGADSLLVANAIDRHVIRPDSPGLVPDPDGGLTIHLGATRPNGAPEGNWLPAPEGPYNVALRTYYPTMAIIEGSWFPPGIASPT